MEGEIRARREFGFCLVKIFLIYLDFTWLSFNQKKAAFWLARIRHK